MSQLPSIEPVRAQVAQLAGGRRKRRFVHLLGKTAFWAAIVLVVVAWFVDIGTFAAVAGGAAALVLAASAVGALWIPVDAVAIAKRYDDVVGTKDLLSSSLELDPDGARGNDGFVAMVREDAAAATGRDVAETLFPVEAPREARWLPVPLAVAVLILVWPLLSATSPVGPTEIERDVLLDGARRIDRILDDADRDAELRSEGVDETKRRISELNEILKREDVGKRRALSEIAKLASQLDKERKDLENRRLEVEKNAAKLARGEDAQDARRDMDAGRYREAAQKVKKKLAKLEKKLKELLEKKAGKIEVDKLKQRIAKLKTLLAELEQLDALGRELGFTLEVLEALDRLEGQLGELGDFDGQTFEEAELMFRRMRRPGQRPENEQMPDKLFASPSNEAGEGHAKKALGKARRSLSEGEEHEQQLRESKGSSSFGQVKTANDGSRSRQAYADAFLAAKRAADDVIYRQNVPAGYRTFIRRYFETMQPDDDAAAANRSGDAAKPKAGDDQSGR